MTQRVIIIGAGLVGLALAHQLAAAGIAVDLVERAVPKSSERVSAINLSTQSYLAALGVWAALPDAAYCPFDRIDTWMGAHAGSVTFDALSEDAGILGYIAQNSAIVEVLWAKALAHECITVHCPVLPCHYQVTADTVTLTLDNSVVLSGQVIVAADGGRSWLRRQMGVDAGERRYGQHAIIATVQTEKTHKDAAYQVFLESGPLGVLPLRDPHHVSIVWSADEVRAAALMAMDAMTFQCELANALGLRLGMMQLVSERVSIPLIMRHAKQYVQPRLALMGDAAHTIHPLAGQGANLGFQDAKVLGEQLIAAVKAEQDCGDLSVLKRYQIIRRPVNQRMALAMLAFREAMATKPTAWAMAKGFNLVDQSALLKRCCLLQ